jgi:hypothetical protein
MMKGNPKRGKKNDQDAVTRGVEALSPVAAAARGD